MSASQITLVIISGLGVIHGLFLAIFLWSYQKGNHTSNKILSLLLLVLSFRIGKSVFFEFLDNLDVKIIFVGLGTLMVIGPLFLFFARSCADKDFRLSRKHWPHFVPATLGVLFGIWINETHLETLSIFLFLILFVSYYGHYLFYLIKTYKFTLKHRHKSLNQESYELLRLLFYALLAIWIVYVLNLFDELIPYIVGPVLYSIVAYLVSFIVIQKDYIQKIDHSKYKTTPVSDEQTLQIFAKASKLIIDEQGYKDPELTLKTLSDTLHVSTQVLSMSINQCGKMNFNSFINHHRIEESLRLLTREAYQHQTIASIAFEVGFNSISSFNAAFKKQTGKTPQEYRKQLIK